jgi:protein FAM32A
MSLLPRARMHHCWNLPWQAELPQSVPRLISLPIGWTQVRKTEEKRIYEAASKTHREKVKEFNQYLNELSEHNDIPKVGPG